MVQGKDSGTSHQKNFQDQTIMSAFDKPTECVGYAAHVASGQFSPFTFTRRACGDDDVVIDIKFAGICHSDIHQAREEWGPATFPMVPGMIPSS